MIYDEDISKIAVSSKFPLGKKDFKHFIGYKDDGNIRQLCIIFPKISINKINFNETKYMPFLIKDDELRKNIMKSDTESEIAPK